MEVSEESPLIGSSTGYDAFSGDSEEVAALKQQIKKEKAGKRKLFHSLVKVANEYKKLKGESSGSNHAWYEGGMWRAPHVLASVEQQQQQQEQQQQQQQQQQQTAMNARQAVSLSELFLDLVIVTAFTRVGIGISNNQGLNGAFVAYFAVFWTIWSKEASYSSRFDTTDLSAQMTTLFTCFAVLFGSLSCSSPKFTTDDSTRMMAMAAFVAIMHCILHVRVAYWNWKEIQQQKKFDSRQDRTRLTTMQLHIGKYAVVNIIMTGMEAIVWLIGIFAVPVQHKYRWVIFLLGILLALRVPRAFLATDFNAACSKRSVLFILLLGFLLQSIVVVASGFFTYENYPTFSEYSFLGAACLLMFCIKLLYVDDSDTNSTEHAFLVNRVAGFCFNAGQFALLLSTTVMGSGLNLLTHDYLASTAALPSKAKLLVTGGFSAVILSTLFIKSMHLKRIPVDNHRNYFVGAYVLQIIVTLAVGILTATMGLGHGGYFLRSLVLDDMHCLLTLCGLAVFLVIISWLDSWIELAIYDSSEDSRQYRVHSFGIWWCLKPEVSDQQILSDIIQHQDQYYGDNGAAGNKSGPLRRASGGGSRERMSKRLSSLSPLLGNSVADLLKAEYKDIKEEESLNV